MVNNATKKPGRKMKRSGLVSFLCGFFFCSFSTAMRQDILGLEKYLAMVRIGWVETPWWLWLIGMVIAALIYGVNEAGESEGTSNE